LLDYIFEAYENRGTFIFWRQKLGHPLSPFLNSSLSLVVLIVFYSSLRYDYFFLCVGAFAVAWVTGITFMLTMTISVLQLREVMI